MSAKEKDEIEDILSPMVLSVSEKEREAEEVWMCESEKEGEEAEEVGMKEKDFLCGIGWEEKREKFCSFWFNFWRFKILILWHVNIFTSCRKKNLNRSGSEIIFYWRSFHLLVQNCI